jgi:hypothetical protein
VAQLQSQLASFTRHPIVPGPLERPGGSDLVVRARRQGREQKIGISTGDVTNLDRLAPLLSVLARAIEVTSPHPYQAIRLEVQATPGAADAMTFTITVRNVGTQPVAIPGLATLRREAGDDSSAAHGIGVQVARLVPVPPRITEPPLQWSRVEVAEADDGIGAPIDLAPGAQRTFRTAARATSPPGDEANGKLLAQAFFSFYRRPAAPRRAHPYLIRGLAFSRAVELNH